MKKVEKLLSTHESVRETRVALEEKTEKDFRSFAQSKKMVRELAHQRYLD